MKKKSANLFWGILMIVGGCIALAQTQGYLTDVQPVFWMVVFAGVSILSLVVYFMSGIQEWGLLFPASIFGGLAVMMGLAALEVNHPAMALPIFVGIGLPFVAAYLLDRPNNWWALIPASVMAFLSFTVLVVDNVAGEVIGAALFFLLATAFALVYVARRQMWAAIVAYVMAVLGIVPLLALADRPELAGALMMFGVALPFFLVYLRNPQERWWAIIPAGVLTTLGVIVTLTLVGEGVNPALFERMINAILYLGLAITFAILWLRHHLSWGLWLSLLAGGMALLTAFLGSMELVWPLLLVLAGAALIFNNLRAKSA